MDYTNDTVDASDAEIGMDKDDAKTKRAGQLAHRFVHNFHVHETGEQTRCGTCGDEKVCLRCTHFGKKECETCGMFVSRTYFANHRRIHSGERPYKCAQCLKSFSRKNTLENHLRRHTGEKPFLCDKCGMQFRVKATLQQHQDSVHSTAREHECDECGKSFKLRLSLMRHLRRVHHRVYTCRQCNEILPTRNAYTEHCLTHFEQASQTDKKSDEVEDFKRGDSSKEPDEAENVNTTEMSD